MTTRAARLAAARRAGFTGRDLILATMDEETWTGHVVGWARAGGFCGVHLRQSHVGHRDSRVGWAALRGIHVARHHEHDDAYGIPDWHFWRIGRWFDEESKDAEVGESFYAELKMWGEKPKPDQVRVINALRAAGHQVFIWNPVEHSEEARARFMAAPPKTTSRQARNAVIEAARDVLEGVPRGDALDKLHDAIYDLDQADQGTIVQRNFGPMSQASIDVADLVRQKQREILERRLGISLGPNVDVDAH